MSVVAPVKAPFTCPKSSDSMRSLGSAAQLIFTLGPPARLLLACSALAASSLPVPLSPTMSTFASEPATDSRRSNIRRIAGEPPSSSPSPDCSARRRLRSEVSARSRRRSSALLTSVSISAASNGLATK